MLACRSTSKGRHRASSALSATVPCVTLSPSGAQAGAMPTAGALVAAATLGKLEEVQTLIEARAHVEEKNSVGDGRGTSVAAGVLAWHVVLNVVQGCGVVNAA